MCVFVDAWLSKIYFSKGVQEGNTWNVFPHPNSPSNITFESIVIYRCRGIIINQDSIVYEKKIPSKQSKE